MGAACHEPRNSQKLHAMKEHDLKGMRVSTDDAISEVTRIRSQLAKVKQELSAVTRDRDGLLVEFDDVGVVG